MFDVDTVFVVASRRGEYVIEDTLRAIRWGCHRSHYVVIVDRTGELELPNELGVGYTVLRVSDTSSKLSDDFVRGVGIKWAIDKGVTCRQYVGISDETLLVGKGFDEFLLKQMVKQGLGLLGVIDNHNYNNWYDQGLPWFEEWSLPHSQYQPDGNTISGSLVVLSAECARAMFDAHMLARSDLEKWPLPYGPFVSWVTQMLGFYQVGWGRVDRQMPPIYLNETSKQTRLLPPPHLLAPSFVLYHSLRCVQGYSEEELREAYKLLRGEVARQPDPMRPTVSPSQTGLTVLG